MNVFSTLSKITYIKIVLIYPLDKYMDPFNLEDKVTHLPFMTTVDKIFKKILVTHKSHINKS